MKIKTIILALIISLFTVSCTEQTGIIYYKTSRAAIIGERDSVQGYIIKDSEGVYRKIYSNCFDYKIGQKIDYSNCYIVY